MHSLAMTGSVLKVIPITLNVPIEAQSQVDFEARSSRVIMSQTQ